jgi:hypothetical protein
MLATDDSWPRHELRKSATARSSFQAYLAIASRQAYPSLIKPRVVAG